MTHPEVIPAIFAKNDQEYREKLRLVEERVERIQVEIADGIFVPRTSIGASVIEADATDLVIDVRLMVADPLAYVGEYSRAGVDRIIFHAESCVGVEGVEKVLEEIKTLGNRAGLAFYVESPLAILAQVADGLDLIQLVMANGVEPTYLEKEVMPKILFIKEHYPTTPLSVTGRIDEIVAEKLFKAGVNELVV